jgi:NAD(P)-dependent dehydrogenase (short-subunit alcohol dehydrogenase family)
MIYECRESVELHTVLLNQIRRDQKSACRPIGKYRNIGLCGRRARAIGKGGKAAAIKGNVPKAADVEQLFDKTKYAFVRVCVLVNNAGVFKFEPLEAVTEDEFHWEFNTNVLGSILMIQEEASCRSYYRDGQPDPVPFYIRYPARMFAAACPISTAR